MGSTKDFANNQTKKQTHIISTVPDEREAISPHWSTVSSSQRSQAL